MQESHLMLKIEIKNLEKKELNGLIPLCHILGFEGTLKNLESRFFDLINFPAHQVRIARDLKSSTLIGFIHFFEAPSLLTCKTIEIGGLAVLPEFRRQGTATKLMLEVEKWAKNKNCASIQLATQIMRKESIQFYEELGFLKEFQTYFMRKNLSLD